MRGARIRSQKRQDNTLADIATTQSWIMPGASGAIYQLIQREFDAIGIGMPSAFCETSSITMLRSLLLNTDQIAVTTSQTIAQELESGAIVRIAGDWNWPKTHTIAYRRSNAAPTPVCYGIHAIAAARGCRQIGGGKAASARIVHIRSCGLHDGRRRLGDTLEWSAGNVIGRPNR